MHRFQRNWFILILDDHMCRCYYSRKLFAPFLSQSPDSRQPLFWYSGFHHEISFASCRISCTCSHTICILLCLASFILHVFLKFFHIVACISNSFLCWVIFHCVSASQCAFRSSTNGHLGCPWLQPPRIVVVGILTQVPSMDTYFLS